MLHIKIKGQRKVGRRNINVHEQKKKKKPVFYS